MPLYTQAQFIAATMLAAEPDDLPNSLLTRIAHAESLLGRVGGQLLNREVIAPLVASWMFEVGLGLHTTVGTLRALKEAGQ